MNTRTATRRTAAVISLAGMRSSADVTLPIRPNTQYYYGNSGSPKNVIVTRVDGDWVYFVEYPYYAERREQIAHFKLSAEAGCKTELKRLEERKRRAGEPFQFYTEWMDHLRLHLADLLAGKPTATVNYTDFQTVKVFVTYPETSNDPWCEFEQVHPHSVSGQNMDAKVLEIYTSRQGAVEMAAEMPAGFAVVKVEDRR